MASDPFNKFQDAVTRATATIGVKASVFVGSTKLKSQISTLKGEIDSLTGDLGVTVYKLWEKDEIDLDLIVEQCNIIKGKYEEIEGLKVEIENLEREETAQSEKASSLVCPNCNTEFDMPVNFCRKCGTKMR